MEKTVTLHKKSTGGSKLSALLVAFIMLLITAISNTARAGISYDFVLDNLQYKSNGDGKTVEPVGCNNRDELSDELIIPSNVTYNSNTYSLTSIGESEFGY